MDGHTCLPDVVLYGIGVTKKEVIESVTETKHYNRQGHSFLTPIYTKLLNIALWYDAMYVIVNVMTTILSKIILVPYFVYWCTNSTIKIVTK